MTGMFDNQITECDLCGSEFIKEHPIGAFMCDNCQNQSELLELAIKILREGGMYIQHEGSGPEVDDLEIFLEKTKDFKVKGYYE